MNYALWGMLVYLDIYEKIQKACGCLTVFLDDEMISQGTCFAFTASGEIITAAHVVTGRFPIMHEDYTDPNCKIFVKFAGFPVIEYKVSLCSIGIQVDIFPELLQIDIAVLLPKVNRDTPFPFLPTKFAIPNLGQRVYLAGYSDELNLPFNLDRIIDKQYPGVAEFLNKMKHGYMADMTGPMIKRAVIGNHRRFFAVNSSQDLQINGDIIYMDNSMHSGSSGGPIVNEKGEVIGIITERAITSAGQSEDTSLKVPSGSTIGISMQPLLGISKVEHEQA